MPATLNTDPASDSTWCIVASCTGTYFNDFAIAERRAEIFAIKVIYRVERDDSGGMLLKARDPDDDDGMPGYPEGAQETRTLKECVTDILERTGSPGDTCMMHGK